MAYVVLIHATFDTKSDADFIYDQAKQVATTASVARIGSAGERTSHCGVFDEQEDGTLVRDRQWHLDRFGIVRETAPIPDDVTPEWVQPTGSQDAYPLTDVFGNATRIVYSGDEWVNDSDVNTQTPGVSGWTNQTTPASDGELDAWEPWTSGRNEDLYQIGDQVTHDGSDWEAVNGNNHWEPGVFGWTAI